MLLSSYYKFLSLLEPREIRDKSSEHQKLDKFINDSFNVIFQNNKNKSNNKNHKINHNYVAKLKNSFQMHELQNTIYNKRKEIINKTTNLSNLQHYYLTSNNSKYSDNQNINLSSTEELKDTKNLIEDINERENYHKNIRLNILHANNINNIFLNYKDCNNTFSNLVNINNANNANNANNTNYNKSPGTNMKLGQYSNKIKNKIFNNLSHSLSQSKDKNYNKTTLQLQTEYNINSNANVSNSSKFKLKNNFFDNDKLKNNLSTIPINNKKNILKNIKINLLKEKMQNLAKFKLNNKIILNQKHKNKNDNTNDNNNNNYDNNNHQQHLEHEKKFENLENHQNSKNSKNSNSSKNTNNANNENQSKENLKKYLKKHNVYQTLKKEDKLSYFNASYSNTLTKSPINRDNKDYRDYKDYKDDIGNINKNRKYNK